MAPDGKLDEAAEKALRELEKSEQFHDALVRDVADRWDAYEGRLEQDMDAADWQSQLHPPYLNHIVETTVAGLIDDRFQFKIRPRPKFYGPGEWERCRQGARAHEILFKSQLADDRFNEFLRPFVLQAAVARFSVAKTFWRYEAEKRKRLVVEDMGAALGYPVYLPRLVEKEGVEAVFDGPVTECVNVKDFYWDEAATAIENARWAADAVWMSMSDLRRLQRDGVYSNVDELEGMIDRNEVGDTDTERKREQRGRKKGRIEVLTIYSRETKKCITIGARKVQLRSRDWPFWHGQYPYVTTSLQPFPFSIQGMSVVEKLMHLQEAAWDMMNQRHDNVRLLNNAIMAVSTSIDNLDALVWEPGALWPLDDPSQVNPVTQNTIPAEVSLAAEGIIKQDMQNLAQTQPFTSTSGARDVGADTATEAALVTNLAQRATIAVKSQLNYSYQRIGEQRMQLNQQFIREPVYVGIGIDTEQEIEEILPHLLAGEYKFDITPMTESLMRAERRAEATAKFQTLMSVIQPLAAMGVLIDGKVVVREWLKEFDEEDVERYFATKPQPAPMEAGAPSASNGNGAGPQGPGGVTAPQSIDPATSPSAQASFSPEVFLQRAGAMGGGPANAS